MTTVMTTTEFEQQPALAMTKATVDGQDVIVENDGQEAAVLVSITRYKELVEAQRDTIWARFQAAREEIFAATADIPPEEMEAMIEESIQASRQARR